MTKLEKLLTAHHIYQRRTTQQIGLSKFGVLCGVSRTALADHLQCRRRLSDKSLKKIAHYMKVPVADLIDEEGG